MQKNVRMLMVAAGVMSLAGCYTQRPLETMPPPPTTRVVAQLTDSGTFAMSNAIGAGALEVEGVVSAADQQSWTLQLLRVDHRDGRSIGWNNEPVVFPSNVFRSPTVKTLDKKKSWIVAGGIAVGAVVIASGFDLIGATEEEDPDGGTEPQQTVIPLYGILKLLR